MKDCNVFAVEDGLEKQVAEAARGRDEDMCRVAALSSKASARMRMQLARDSHWLSFNIIDHH